MNNTRPFHSDYKNQDLLAPFRSIFFQYFEQLVDSCCLRLDLEFGLQLGKDREKISMENYKALIEYLRSVRDTIKRNYLLKLNENFNNINVKTISQSPYSFDLPAISLASDDFVKENYTSSLIIRQCEQLYHEDLIKLNKHVASLLGKSAISERQNPVAPDSLFRALFEIIKPLKLNSDHRVALYKTFEADVFTQLGFIYRELIKNCETTLSKQQIENGTDINKPKLSATAPEKINNEFRNLQIKLDRWRSVRTSSDYDPLHVSGTGFYEHFEIKNALQILGQFATIQDPDKHIEQHSLKRQVFKRLKELDFSDEIKSLTKVDEDVLDLVSFIFQIIAESPILYEPLKTVLLQLKIPMSAACLGQYSAIINPKSPIRKILDDLFSASVLFNPNDEENRLICERITGFVKKLTKDSGFDISGWCGVAKEVELFMESQHQGSKLIEERSIQAMLEEETKWIQNKSVNDAIDDSIKNKALPSTVIDFLKNIWRHVLLNAYAAKDEQPELWESAVKTMKELIASVNVSANENERNQTLKFIPKMIKDIRSGLNRISCDKETQSRFFKELAVLHLILMNKKGAKTSKIDVCNDTPDINGQIVIEPERVSDTDAERLSALTEGQWVVFGLNTSNMHWGKLARKGLNNEKLLFISKNSEKITQLDANELAEQFKHGQAEVIEFNDKPITDRVLTELLSCTPIATD